MHFLSLSSPYPSKFIEKDWFQVYRYVKINDYRYIFAKVVHK